jgi:hypothetical protein
MSVGRRRIPAFDAESLKILETLSDSTWSIFELRHPFRDTTKDDVLRRMLRLKLFIHAENCGLEDLDDAQTVVLQSMSRELE